MGYHLDTNIAALKRALKRGGWSSKLQSYRAKSSSFQYLWLPLFQKASRASNWLHQVLRKNS